ncbi:MAG: tetratricopeptide repeat protein, partial [Desulfobacula sp.]|nr:tetratricopeptide repeat protein [Desulfobacula sp.]
NRLVEADPENDKNRMAVAVLLMKSGELDQSLEIVEKGIERSRENYGYFALLSEIYLKKSKVKKAENVLWEFLSEKEGLALPDIIKAKVSLSKLFLLQKRSDEAEDLIDQVLEDDPKNIDAHYLKGRMYLVSGDGTQAVSKFRTVTQEHPEHLEGYIGLANAHVLNKDYDLALDVLKNALEKAPNSAKILKGMVRVNVLKKDVTAAEENLKQIVSLDPYNIGSIAGLGDFYLSMNRYEEAMNQYQLIKKSKKGAALGYLKTAQAFTRQNKVDDAIDELKTGSEKAEKSSVFITSLGQLYLRQGKIQEAIVKFKEALAIDPKNRLAWLTLANIYERTQDQELAMDVYRKFLALHPDSWSAANNLAFLLSEQEQPESSLQEALILAQKAESLNPGSPLVLDTIGWIYYKQGDLSKAEHKIAQAIKKMPDNRVISYHLGLICHDMGKGLDAGVNLKNALAGNNEFPGRKHALKLYDKYYK